MAAQLLEGKVIADKIKEALKKEIVSLKEKTGLCPKLVSVQAGENPASSVYIKSQKKTAEILGIEYVLDTLDADITQEGLIDKIIALNLDAGVSGIIVQLPLPKGIDHKLVMSAISAKKDAEGMHPENLGHVLLGDSELAPCTAQAAMQLITSTGIELYGKEAVVVGHSEIVGKPLSMLLLNKFVTTTVCHIATGQRGILPEHVKGAEILVVAVGKAGLIKGDWIKEGAIVVDVGINRVGDKLVGDVEFESARDRAGFITPVPGGVGPLTVTMLMRNVVSAFKIQHKI
ncbi:MAG: bifunctional 5,10-methylene-tetrahydrofolate dehydrogenase/5,10-methylene-tetrahydrofolate cyclohydrolase [Omnitrophica bacterium RBG_13_46_9]|nr:MAG: bifunctional 5,10-methylene-tetrahydrofolate dehydrogenase/5,10-methylene-tetrahydrofolate cyclohydrolase [Omnitrophica bacterium RBG_13_46_9]